MHEEEKQEALNRQFDELYQVLIDDVVQIERVLKTEDTQVWRRAFCRAVFSMMEGMNAWLKQYVVETYWPGFIDDETRRELSDQRLLIDKTGAERPVSQFKPFAENFFFAFDSFAWTSGSSFCPKKDAKEWAALIRAKEIRDRIVHPKASGDLVITDEELTLLRHICSWYLSLLHDLLYSSASALFNEMKALHRAWNKSHPEKPLSMLPMASESPELEALLRSLEAKDDSTGNSWQTRFSD